MWKVFLLCNSLLTIFLHCVKSVQIRSHFWSAFSCIRTKYRKIRTRNNFVFGQFSRSVSFPIFFASNFFHLFWIFEYCTGYIIFRVLLFFVHFSVLSYTAWKASKYGVISGPHFPIFGLNTGKYGPEITPYLDTFHAVIVIKIFFIFDIDNMFFYKKI